MTTGASFTSAPPRSSSRQMPFALGYLERRFFAISTINMDRQSP
jgi:hypothetical protein